MQRALPMIVALCWAFALTAAESVPHPAPPAVSPQFQRCELAAGTVVTIAVTLSAASACVVRTAEFDCGCMSVLTPLPLSIPEGISSVISLRVAAVQSGIRAFTLHTSLGEVRASVQIVTDGLGQGLDVARQISETAEKLGCSLWVIVHDLRGELRNCGCSGGSLGGIDHLASLPGWLRMLAPGTHMRFLLSGDSDGPAVGLGAALIAHGWERDDEKIIVTAQPDEALQRAGVVAVIPVGTVATQHRRLVRPLLGGGMTAEILLVDDAGLIAKQVTLPIDRTLPRDETILLEFAMPLTKQIDAQANPSSRCISCHAAAHETWLASRHARAWASLAVTDRGDDCISCHSTPIAKTVVAQQVHCQSCHAGSDEHAAAKGAVRTTGTVDCRTCHDARHHPAFDMETRWKIVAHGK